MKRAILVIALLSAQSANAQLAPVHDAYVRSGAYSNTVLDDGLLVVRSPGEREGYVQFLLPGIRVQTAILRLTCVNTTSTGIVQAAYLVPTTWSQITWNTKPAYTVELGRWTATEGNTIEIDVTEAVQASDSTFGIAIVGVSGTGIARYGTLEQGSAASLVITEVSDTPFEYSLEVTPTTIRYTLPHGAFEVTRDAMEILPRMNTYQNTADDLAAIVDYMALRGEVLVIPPLGGMDSEALNAALVTIQEQAVTIAQQAEMITDLNARLAEANAETIAIKEANELIWAGVKETLLGIISSFPR